MPAEPRVPLPVVLCSAAIRATARLVPAAERERWKHEHLISVRERWHFLFHPHETNFCESLKLFAITARAGLEGIWSSIARESVVKHWRYFSRSPWTCLSVLTSLLLITAVLSSGLPATRDVVGLLFQRHSRELLFISLHPYVGANDRGVPLDVLPAWETHSRLLEGISAFNVTHAEVYSPEAASSRQLVVKTEPAFFSVLNVRPKIGTFPSQTRRVSTANESGAAVVLNYHAWIALLHSDPNISARSILVGDHWYRVAAVLPKDFRFLTRQPCIYLVQQQISDPRVMVLARVGANVNKKTLDRELTRIARDVTFYFFRTQLRLAYLDSALLTPLEFFELAVGASVFVAAVVFGVPFRRIRFIIRPENRRMATRRIAFFLMKTVLALSVVFVAGLEWSRSESTLLLGSRDPASGPLLVWLYVLGAMGVLFWSIVDQKARCRDCLRLLCFPVRMGSPGRLLLDWSGTELLCTQGHGVLHVPDLAASWDEESERWISMDDSWRGLFDSDISIGR